MTKKRSKRTTKGRLAWKELLLSLFLILIVWAGQDLVGEGGPGFRRDVEGKIEVVFTAPTYPEEAANRYGGLDEQLADAIDEAERTVDVAAYDFDLERVADALIRAHERGLRVRLVTDSDYADELGPVRLEAAGIPVVYDERGAFMHDKFVVLDEAAVWTGSWNLTDYGTYRNNNNVVIVESQALAQNYTTEFEEMFEEGAFGPTSPAETPYSQVEVGEILVENYFGAEEEIAPRIIEQLEEAETSIQFLAFTFTDDGISGAMNRKHREGVLVQGVVESRNAGSMGSDVEALQKAGADVLKDGNPYNMHHKVIIIDGTIVITGSYNFTRNAADSNDENVLIIHSPGIAASYLREFDRVYQLAREAE